MGRKARFAWSRPLRDPSVVGCERARGPVVTWTRVIHEVAPRPPQVAHPPEGSRYLGESYVAGDESAWLRRCVDLPLTEADAALLAFAACARSRSCVSIGRRPIPANWVSIELLVGSETASFDRP